MHITSVTKKSSDGRILDYYRLSESYRMKDGRPSKRMLCALGYLDELPELSDRLLLIKAVESLAYDKQHLFTGNPQIDTLALACYNKIISNGKLEEVASLKQEYNNEQKRIEAEDERKGIERVYLESLKNINPREIGAEHVCKLTLDKLDVVSFLRNKGWQDDAINFAIMQIISRAIYPVSEYKTVSYLRENSALCELLGIDASKVNHQKLYRSADKLYSIHEEIEDYLNDKVCSIFDIKNDILLFDLTNTYFEGRMLGSKLAKFGRSKEKRNDCRIVVLAAVVNADGLLVRTRIFEGNRNDMTTMQDIMSSLTKEQLRKGKTKDDITVVMDAGISSKENLQYLKDNDYKFITVARSAASKYKSLGEGIKTVYDNKEQEIRLERVAVEGEEDTFLLVDSYAKTLKERGMYEKSCQYFEDGLSSIAAGILKKGGTKKLDKVYERIGRLKSSCSKVWKDYEIKTEHNEKNIVSSFTWERKSSNTITTESKHGKYLLRTNIDETKEENIWQFYNTIREVESTFRCLKTDLEIRPIYHKGDKGTKAHLNLAVLAYWVVSVVRYQLSQAGIHNSWTEIVRILHTHKIVSTRALKGNEEQIEIRQCTEPEEKVVAIYRTLKISNIPIKKRKFVVHPDNFIENFTTHFQRDTS